MIEEISLRICSESGESIIIKDSQERLDIKLDTVIADTFSKICFRLNGTEDREIRTAEKFMLAVHLNKFLEESNNAD